MFSSDYRCDIPRIPSDYRCSQCREKVVQRSRRQNDVSTGALALVLRQHPWVWQSREYNNNQYSMNKSQVLPQRKLRHHRSPNVVTDRACSVALIAQLFGRSPVEFRESHTTSMGLVEYSISQTHGHRVSANSRASTIGTSFSRSYEAQAVRITNQRDDFKVSGYMMKNNLF